MPYKNKANKTECNRRYYLADRDRFLADGHGCEMQEPAELPCDESAAKEL
jgi:hypothetical protein